MNSPNGHQLSEPMRLALIASLTKEVETLATNIMMFRTRAAFLTWVGPFVLLGTVMVRLPSVELRTRELWIEILLIAGVFVGLGFFGGHVERQAWRQCNRWRELVAEIATGREFSTLELRAQVVDSVISRKVKNLYVLVFVLLLVAFLALGSVTLRTIRSVEVLPQPSRAANAVSGLCSPWC